MTDRKPARNKLSENKPPERTVTETDRGIYKRYPTLTLTRDSWPENFKKYELTTMIANTVLKLTAGESMRLNPMLLHLQHLNFRWHQAPTVGTRNRVEKLIRKEENRILRLLKGRDKRSMKQLR